MKDPAPPDHRELPLDLLDQLDRICDRFEAAWESGARPQIEDFLRLLKLVPDRAFPADPFAH